MKADGQNKQLHEINKYDDASFPVQIFRANSSAMEPAGRWIKDYHWHEELQFTYVNKGNLKFQAGETSYALNEGDAVFVNSGVVHAVISMSSDGEYSSLNFPARILSFFPGSRMEQECVIPYISNSLLSSFCITNDMTSVLKPLKEINRIFGQKDSESGVYRISILIAELWEQTLTLLRDREGIASVNPLKQQRLQSMLSFIGEHYMDDISLEDIAGTAHISVGECSRIFRDMLHVSPYAYLSSYRIQMSIDLLAGDWSVADVAGLVGYNQTSNYISAFRRQIGCTPAKYRKQTRSNS